MAVTASKQLDYIVLEYNVIPGVPEVGYTPLVGELVTSVGAALNNGYLLSGAATSPTGIIIDTNAQIGVAATRITVALLVPGTTLLLSGAAPIAIGSAIQTTATGLVAVGTSGLMRSEIVAAGGGIGQVISVGDMGANTVVVLF